MPSSDRRQSFLLLELLNEIARQGIAPARESAALASRLSSQGVGRAVRARLRRLAPPCAALARAVAVLGDRAEPSMAARLAGVEEEAASRAADALADAANLEPGRRLSFAHPLLHANVYAELSAGERATEHERAARLLADAGAAPDRIAIHLLASDPRGNAETVTILRRAAEGASGRGAPEVAVAHLRRALAEPPAAELRPVLAHELGAAALRAGDLDTAIEQLRAAIAGLPVEDNRAQAANALGSTLFLAHRPDDAVAELSAVIDELPDRLREHGLRLQATRRTAARASLPAWRSLRARGDRFGVFAESAATTGECLALAVAWTARRAGAQRRRGARARRPRAGAGQAARRPRPGIRRLLDRPARPAVGRCARGRHARRHRGDGLGASARLAAGARDGCAAACVRVVAARLAHRSRGGRHQRTRARRAPRIPALRLRRARERAALPRQGRTSRRDPAAGPVRARKQPSRLYYLQARARLHATSRRTEEALEDLFACGRLEQEWEISTPAFCNWRADAAVLLGSLDRRDEALRLAREELDRCRGFGAAGSLGAALRTLGVLESGEAGIALLMQAVDVLGASPEPLRRALELARGCGADAVVTRAHDELVAAGARPRRDPIESRSELTAAELRVARMAAEGMTNREIAQGLFLTENTIQTHLRNAFRKLDIPSRSQLARSLDPQTP